MSRSTSVLALASLCCCLLAAAAVAQTRSQSAGSPLFLSPYIECENFREARQKAEVRLDGVNNVTSYAGYITVNKAYNSNMFFWFVASQSNPSKDPLILWSNGGPGVTGMDALLNYNGPFFITKNQQLRSRKHALTKNHNIIYIDTPIGVGFSFTDNEAGYAKTPNDIGRDTIAFLEQFYQIFPEFRSNDLYMAGDSYGARIAITLGRVTKEHNRHAQVKFNLKGLILGSAFIDPQIQQVHADYMYEIGLIDYNERNIIKADDVRLINDTTPNYYTEETVKFERFLNFSGSYLQNYRRSSEPEDVVYLDPWIKTPKIRSALHAGNYSFDFYSKKVADSLLNDMSLKVTSDFEQALDDYRVLAYFGQLDLTFPYSSTQTLYRSLKWSGADNHKKAAREKWNYERELAGYIKRVGKFEDVLVRNAGHIAAYDQPAWICDLTTKFTHGK